MYSCTVPSASIRLKHTDIIIIHVLCSVGPEDIYGGNLKLILGLIWTLIKEYQIKSKGKAMSTKKAMLAWIATVIPEYGVDVSLSLMAKHYVLLHCITVFFIMLF